MKKFRICTSIAVSICGNFIFIGYEDGILIKLSTSKGIF